MTASTKNGAKAGARKRGPAVAKGGLRDDTGAWRAELGSEAHAAQLGRIVGMMPQVEALAIDLAARLLGRRDLPARTIYRGLADEAARLELLAVLARRGPGADERVAAVARYAAARKRWQAYVTGLWYTHDSGRAFLAPPDIADAAFRVAREVKTTELAGVVKQLGELSETLTRLSQRPAKARAKPEATPRPAAPSPRHPVEAARTKRSAPLREPGKRRPGKATFVSPLPSATPAVPEAAE
jgi:hypothetical protein